MARSRKMLESAAGGGVMLPGILMNQTFGYSLFTAALASLVMLGGTSALGDSLVTTDGDMYSGHIRKTESGYTVDTPDGPIDVAADKVKKILFDHPQAAPTGPSIPDAKGTLPTPGTTGVTGTHAKDPKMLKSLLAQGQAAMAAGEFSDARDAFTDALSLDSSNAVAGRGLGFAYIKLGKVAKATKPLEVAALPAQPMDRSLTVALSASLVASHNPARAVKYLKAYLEAHPTPLDEPVVNALGTALSLVERPATRSALFTDGVKLYVKFNDQLNAAQTDKKRWGVEWLPTDDVDKKQKAHAAAQKTADLAWDQLQTANNAVASAQTALNNAQQSGAYRELKAQQIQTAQNQLNDATAKQKPLQDVYDASAKALAEAPGPTFPTEIPLDDVDLSMNPNAGVAAATPTPGPTAIPPPAVDATATAIPPVRHNPSPTPVNPTANTDPTPAPVANADKTQHSTRYAVAFAIAPDVLVTAASAVEDATDIEITTSDGKSLKAEILRAHHADGIALLKVEGGKLPCLMLADAVPGGSSLSCLGYPEVDLFNPLAKSMTVSGADQTDSWTVRFEDSPRLPGGPILEGNAVVGVELGDRDSDLAAVPAVSLKVLLKLVADSAHPGEPAKDPKTAVVQVMAER